MTDQNNSHILQSTFFNIDVYNDNSTGDDISSIYQTSLQSPLLIHPNEHEICCCRARIPLDQVPLSQDNIPFQKWQIEIGVPVVATPGTYTYYNSYVPQFNAIITTAANFNIGIVGQTLYTSTLPENEPTTIPPTLTLTPKTPALPIDVDFVIGSIGGYKGLSNTVFGISYTAVCINEYTINRYVKATNVFVDSVNLRTLTARVSLVIVGICMPINSNKVYALTHDNQFAHTLIDVFNTSTVFLNLAIPSPRMNLLSMSCSSTILSISYDDTDILNHIINYNLSPMTITYLSGPFSSVIPTTKSTFINFESPGSYFVGEVSTSGISTFTLNNILNNEPYLTYTLPFYSAPYRYFLMNFLGTDMYGNLIVTANNGYGGFVILSYGKVSTQLRYTIDMGNNRPIVTSTMVMATTTYNNPLPYPIFTINEYLDQINIAFYNIFSQLPEPLSSPLSAPFLSFDSTLSIINLNTDASCSPSSTTIACKINFNKLLMSFFKFTSTLAVSTNLGIGSRTITIAINKTITPQPNSTLYRFADLTRILIGTSRISVKGDNQSSNELLVNFSDFVVDTENGIPNLIIYQPTILRWYQLYQTSPLNSLDVFVSYANRAGKVFPINISPYNSIGIKLQFRNSNSSANQYSDSRT